MNFKQFQRTIIRNYIVGSLVAVIIVGSTFISQTLNVPSQDMTLLLAILLFSLFCMFTSEFLVFRLHIKPIKRVFTSNNASKEHLRSAYLRTLHFPILTFKRIMLPHFLGIAIPSSILTSLFIFNGLLSIPYYFIIFAWLGSFLIAFLHAIIEFFLTTNAIKPILKSLKERTLIEYNTDLSFENYVLISIQKKFFLSTLFIGVFPVTLFSLATFIRLLQIDPFLVADYWRWAGIIIILVVLISVYFSVLLSREVQQPMNQLQLGMKNVQSGKLEPIDGYYSDEFSNLISGFNHMTQSIIEKENLNEDLVESYFSVFAATLDARDSYTSGHSTRVAHFAYQIGKEAGLANDELNLLRKSALLHDIGKIGVRDEVLLKDGKLTEEEFEQIKLHPTIGAEILEKINPKEAMEAFIPGVKYHHERYDGKGYPDGLFGTTIPTFGRILAVADAYDAMTSDRTYRKGMAKEKALSILDEGKGTQWDPYFAQLFIDWMKTNN
ncbi:HD domain-containing protein [Aquibacillus halophilus]|uniref:HD domain-containing protein n=1 Tax=Aquibacillus halophilus TaxID=930132 RepID=A0A6A8DGD5_9BACI|nr:HD domain-containing phosphohydrolase [Aquibacillus halophilus]MRH44290.1 HD domain-containing protein [Aquibacillus halophilus]